MQQGGRFFLSLWVSAAVLAAAGGAELAALDIPRCDTPPVLDGALDDPAWQAATQITELYLRDDGRTDSNTVFLLMYDAEYLYLGARCRNPNMPQITQRGYDHDGEVYNDDSIRIYIRPDAKSDLYDFIVLNFANVIYDERCSAGGMRDRGWNPPLRSMTRRQPEGWTAELAIPLSIFDRDDLGGMAVNLVRHFAEVQLDAYGAAQGEKLVSYVLHAANRGGFHEFANFQAAGGLGGFKPTVPFAPRIVAAELTGYLQDDAGICSGIALRLAAGTPVAGRADLVVVENFGAEDVETHKELVELRGTGARAITLKVPSPELRARQVKILLVDPARPANVLAYREISDVSALQVIRKAFVGRSYYTSEDNAEFKVELGLPPEMLVRAVLVVEVDGAQALELTGLTPVMTSGVSVATLKIGENPVTFRVMLGGRELAAQTVSCRRLAPRPGYETKADFIKGVIRKDDRPFFPVGTCGHTLQAAFSRTGEDDHERIFEFLARDIGMNTVVRMYHASNLPAFMELAAKHGLNVITWSNHHPNNLPPPWRKDLPLVERLAMRRQWYDELEPGLIAESETFRDYKNFIGYWNVDEPNLGLADEKIVVAEWYQQTIQAVDPYRPCFLLYSKHIPHGDIWTRSGDILGFDVYPRPYGPWGAGTMLAQPGLYTAFYAWQLRERCRRDNKIMWFVPLANMLDLASGRTPIGMRKEHMMCQAYAAIIYGARGLLYFSLNNTVGADAWDALRTVSKHVREMAPALLNGDIAQELKYTPDNFRPMEQKFPMVNAAVFQYPDGDYLLLAVNIMSHAVDTTFQVAGLSHAVRLYDADGALYTGKLQMDGESFSDKIEPGNVRAYRLKITDDPAPVRVSLKMTPVHEERAVMLDVRAVVERMRQGKNYCPNPCFQHHINKGVPSFTRNLGGACALDEDVRWNGRPSLRLYSPSAKTRVFFPARIYNSLTLQGCLYPPESDQPAKMTFSFYARSDQASSLFLQLNIGDWLAPQAVKKSFKLDAEWTRCHLTFDLPPVGGVMGARAFDMTPRKDTTVWVTGLQLEPGDTPTEFQDDFQAALLAIEKPARE